MADEVADALRQMALHRGLKLVKSRRRKPGTGDFGKFGLTDEKGTVLIGFGEKGLLTASAEEIETYLRAGAVNTWKQSASLAPDPPRSKPKARPGSEPLDESTAGSDPRSRRKTEPPRSASASRTSKGGADRPPARLREPEPSPAPEPTRRAKPKLEIVRNEPVLALRAAKPADAAGLARLLGKLGGVSIGEMLVDRHLAAIRKSGGGTHLAEIGPLVGCISWTLVQTLQHGAVGRISLLFVDEGHRRRGIGNKLLAVAEAALAKKGCTILEVMSDIDIRNSHNFFRSGDFEQTSYRFARPVRTGEAAGDGD
jgi:GNAT superfamily N-acetyltransferase